MYRKYIKRIMDIFFSIISIIAFLPLFILIIIIQKLSCNDSVFFVQQRPGKNKKLFKIYKFRTMIRGADRYQKVGVEVGENDIRITEVGKYLRRYKIDELAQLINILKGDMSFVGPRPTLIEYLKVYEEWELKKFDVKPGLTGLAQINGGIYLKRKEKSLYDVKYIENISFVNDIRIVFKTVAVIFLGEKKFL